MILTVEIGNVPSVRNEERAELDHLGDPDDGFSHLTLRYGYMENPRCPEGNQRGAGSRARELQPDFNLPAEKVVALGGQIRF